MKVERRLILVLWAIVLLGVGLRVFIALWSRGTNDVETWRHFGEVVDVRGLEFAYGYLSELNHPPIPIYWARLGWLLELAVRADFGLVMKMPAILADAGSCLLLWGFGRRVSAKHGLVLASMMAFSPLAIAISGYHGNTDNVYAMFTLAACLAVDKRPLLAGLLLGAAINVKIIPVLMIPGILMTRSNWRDVGRIITGLLIAALPFVIAFILVGPLLLKKLLGYASNEESWGVMLLLSVIGKIANDPAPWLAVGKAYNGQWGRWIMLAIILLCAWRSRYLRAPSIAAAATAACVFLVMAPGFGVQYLILPGVLLLAATPRLGFHFGWVAGMFAWMTYYQFMNHADRPISTFYDLIQPPASAVGLMAWIILLMGLRKLTRSNQNPPIALADEQSA